MNSIRLNNLSLKYQRFTQSGFKDIGKRKFELMAKTRLLFAKSQDHFGTPKLRRCDNLPHTKNMVIKRIQK